MKYNSTVVQQAIQQRYMVPRGTALVRSIIALLHIVGDSLGDCCIVVSRNTTPSLFIHRILDMIHKEGQPTRDTI